MTVKMTAAILVVAWAGGVAMSATAGQTPPAAGQTPPAAPAASTWGGVYTEEQAEAGAKVYAKTCSECHLDDLAGDGFAPALKGPDFMNNWNSLAVADLFERIRVSMPPTDPASVSAKEKADIVAYLLKAGGFPAGKTALPAEPEALKKIKFEATKPGAR